MACQVITISRQPWLKKMTSFLGPLQVRPYLWYKMSSREVYRPIVLRSAAARNRTTMPKRKRVKKPKCVYRPRNVTEFETLIVRASRGDPGPLCEYLREGGLPISRDDASWLAWLLERKLPRSRGRPPGSLSCKNAAVQCASYLVRLGKHTWCEHHGKKIATKKTPVDRL